MAGVRLPTSSGANRRNVIGRGNRDLAGLAVLEGRSLIYENRPAYGMRRFWQLEGTKVSPLLLGDLCAVVIEIHHVVATYCCDAAAVVNRVRGDDGWCDVAEANGKTWQLEMASCSEVFAELIASTMRITLNRGTHGDLRGQLIGQMRRYDSVLGGGHQPHGGGRVQSGSATCGGLSRKPLRAKASGMAAEHHHSGLLDPDAVGQTLAEWTERPAACP